MRESAFPGGSEPTSFFVCAHSCRLATLRRIQSTMVRLRACGSLSALFIAWALLAGSAWAQAPSTGSNLSGQGVALQLGESLQSLQTAISSLDPDQLPVPKGEKKAIAEGQASLMRNLNQAIPGLLQAFRAAPENLGAAFRLYQDADAVLAVAQRSVAVLPEKDDDNGGVELRSATDELRQSLNQLGSWIEVRGSADYAAHHQAVATHPAGPAASAAPPPATLVIQDANTTAKTAKKKAPAKKKQPPTIPHR